MSFELEDYDLDVSLKIKLRLNNGEIKYHKFDADLLDDRMLDNIFEAIDEELEKIYKLEWRGDKWVADCMK